MQIGATILFRVWCWYRFKSVLSLLFIQLCQKIVSFAVLELNALVLPANISFPYGCDIIWSVLKAPLNPNQPTATTRGSQPSKLGKHLIVDLKYYIIYMPTHGVDVIKVTCMTCIWSSLSVNLFNTAFITLLPRKGKSGILTNARWHVTVHCVIPYCMWVSRS